MNQKVMDRIWKVIWVILLVLQVITGAAVMIWLIRLDILPEGLLVATGLLLVLIAAGAGFLLFFPKKKKRQTLRIAGSAVSVVAVAGCFIGSQALGKLYNTMGSISGNTEVTDVVGVFVMTDDPAKALKDAEIYQFACCRSYDYANSLSAFDEIQKELGKEPQLEEYVSVGQMVEDFYKGTFKAMILNEAYIDVLEEQDEYQNFSADTRIIYEYQIVQTIPENTQKPDDPQHTDAPADTGSEAGLPITERPFIVYLSGSDTRQETLTKSRSDVNILVVVNPKTKQVLLVNTPRDYYIKTSVSKGAKDKLTNCGIYGINCSMDTLSDLYHEPIDYYGQINFNGFEKMIDAIGGITVDSDKDFITTHGEFHVVKGKNNFNGAQALSYVRERYAYRDGDFHRGRNQMQVIEAIVKKMSAGTLVKNYSEILDSLEGMFVTNVSSSEMSELVKMQISDGAEWTVNSYTSQGKVASAETFSSPGHKASIVEPYLESVEYAQELIDRVKAGEKLTAGDMLRPE